MPRADVSSVSFFDATDKSDVQGFHRIMVTEPEHPYVGHWWVAGCGLGYEHGFTHQVVDLVTDISSGTQPTPSFADALQVQRVMAAVEESAGENSRWTGVN